MAKPAFLIITMPIISLSIPDTLLQKVDQHIKQQGYQNRSEITRQALRAYISEAKNLSELQGKITATITVIYKKGAKTQTQNHQDHSTQQMVLTFLHTHIEEGYCIEVIVARGEAKDMQTFITELKANKQIQEVKTTIL
jgi:CopG family transcriptional regulator, nickel-responsive regulator